MGRRRTADQDVLRERFDGPAAVVHDRETATMNPFAQLRLQVRSLQARVDALEAAAAARPTAAP